MSMPSRPTPQIMRQPPSRPAAMFQSWRDLLFLHWRISPDEIQRRLPRGLTVDPFDGSAWIGIVPFLMRRIRPAGFPAVPYLSNFLELNVRTYVVDECGVPGVWFFSLNADRWLAVQVARRWFHLPYWTCRMSATHRADGLLDYRCRRLADPQGRTFTYRYRPLGPTATALPGSLDEFLVERYLLFAQRPDGEIAYGRVSHIPYEIGPADIPEFSPDLFDLDGLPIFARFPDHAAYSPGVDVEVFGLMPNFEILRPDSKA